MRVAATILTYWTPRRENINASVKALMSGTVKPDTVTVVNNDPRHPFNSNLVRSVNCSWNSQTRGKYGAALLEPADYHLILDDDITVGARTLERFLSSANDFSCSSGRGILLDENFSYWHGKDVWPDEVDKETVVDSIVGRIQFLSTSSILRMFSFEKQVRLDDGKFLHEAEDILIGLVNRSTVLPMRKDELPVNLPENGVSLCQSVTNYAAMRDEVTTKIIDILKHEDYPAISEAPWKVKLKEKQ